LNIPQENGLILCPEKFALKGAWGNSIEFCSNITYIDIGLGAFAASELDKVFSGYQPR
jgi:hypothetical protein